MQLKSIPFMVLDRPQCAVGLDLIDRNVEFLKNVRPEYFQSTCSHLLYLLSDEVGNAHDFPKAYVATNIRLLYGQSLEALFALMFGLLQAPFCVPGWLQSYRSKELRKLVAGMNNGQAFEHFKIKLDHNSWAEIARLVTVLPAELPDMKEIIAGYGRLWGILADDFLNDKRRREYNSLKHGFRVIQGGFRFSMGKEASPGIPASQSSMQLLGSSPYGSMIFHAEPIDNRNKKVATFTLRRLSFNWDLECLAARIELIRYSIQNIVSLSLGLSKNDLTDETI